MGETEVGREREREIGGRPAGEKGGSVERRQRKEEKSEEGRERGKK